MFQDILMLAALFILRIGVPLLLVVGIGYTILERVTGFKLDWSPRFVTAVGAVLALWAFAAIAIMLRLTNGLGAVTNLTDQFPLGMWIGFDVMAGAMLGGGAFFLAGLVYVFGMEHYRPILRSTILTAFLGYSLLIVALLIDVGRPQNIMLARPVYFINVHSVLWEVAICVLCYTTVLALEFSPALFERLRWKRAWQIAHKLTLPLVIVGILLSTMHQSSLGSLWLITPGKLNDLWYTPWLPVFFWISAIGVGIGMVIVESNLSSRGFKRGPGARPAGEAGEVQRIPVQFLRLRQVRRSRLARQAVDADRADPAGAAVVDRSRAVRGAAGDPAVQPEDAHQPERPLCHRRADRGRRHPEPVERQPVRDVELHRADLHPVADGDRGDRGALHLRCGGVRSAGQAVTGVPHGTRVGGGAG